MSNLFYLDFNRVIHLKAEIAEDRSEEVLKQVLRLPGIHFACNGQGIKLTNIKQRIKETILPVDLDHNIKKPVSKYSLIRVSVSE